MTQEADNPFGRLVVDVPECFRLYAKLTSENNALLSELAQLRNWKESAMGLLLSYDIIAESFGGALGSSKVHNLERGVAQLREALQKIQDYDNECACEHDNEDCCELNKVFCPRCIAARTLLPKER